MKKPQLILLVSLNFKTINWRLEYHKVLWTINNASPHLCWLAHLQYCIQILCNFKHISVQCENNKCERNKKKIIIMWGHSVLILEKLRSTGHAHSRVSRKRGIWFILFNPRIELNLKHSLAESLLNLLSLPDTFDDPCYVTSLWLMCDPSIKCYFTAF